MSEWKTYKLKEICNIKSGKRLPKGCDFSSIPTDYRYIRARDIKNGVINGDDLVFISEDVREKLSNYIVNANDIAVTIVGASVGDVAYVTPEFDGVNLTENAVRLTNFNQQANPRFIFYILNSPVYYKLMQKFAGGAAQPKLGIYKVEAIEVTLPSLQNQNLIATILSRYDSLIENYQKQIKLLEEAAQRLYKEWFIDLHFPGYENTKIVDGVPEGWEEVTLDKVTSKITTGLNPRKNFVLGKGSNYYVTIKNMADNTFFLDDRCDKVDNDALGKINKRSDLKIGDILFSGIGTIGRVALVDRPTNNWNVSESVFTMRVNEYVTKEFLYLMLLGPDVQNYCQSNAHGAAQKGIRMADLKSYCFNLPPFGLILKFTGIVSPILKEVSSLRKQIRLLTEARDRLLPKLMSGEIAI